jgi:hypothetical protein
MSTVQMVNDNGSPVAANNVMFTVGKLSRMSRREDGEGVGDLSFDSEIGKIQTKADGSAAIFDMSSQDAKKLVEFSKDVDAGGAKFSLLKELAVERGRNFGSGGKFGDRGGGGGGRFGRDNRQGGGRGDFRKNNSNDQYRGNRASRGDVKSRGYGNQNNYSGRGNESGGRGGGGYGASDDGNRGRQSADRTSGGRDGFRGRYDNKSSQRSNDEW